MKTRALVHARPALPAPTPSVTDYFEASGPDYAAWSPGMHMHFGFWRRGLSPFDREGMLEQMTDEVSARLHLDGNHHDVIDIGCGVGASTRRVAAQHAGWRTLGVSVVAEQIRWARQVAAATGSPARFETLDYTRTGLAEASFDGAYAIESACYAAGPSKLPFIREAARILRPGARLVVADGFLRREPTGWFARATSALAHNWAVPELARIDLFTRALEAEGFDNVVVEDVSWRVAPSALHVPWVLLRFLAGRPWQDPNFGRLRWGHLLSSALAPLVGAHRRGFGYFVVSAERSTRRALPPGPRRAPPSRSDPSRTRSAG